MANNQNILLLYWHIGSYSAAGGSRCISITLATGVSLIIDAHCLREITPRQTWIVEECTQYDSLGLFLGTTEKKMRRNSPKKITSTCGLSLVLKFDEILSLIEMEIVEIFIWQS